MTGKKHVQRKVIGKKHQRLSPRKLDLKKEKEEVKMFGGLVAEMTAVQAELIEVLDDNLLKFEWNENRHLEDLQITAHQLRQVNVLRAQLNAKVQDYLVSLLDVLEQADQDKDVFPP